MYESDWLNFCTGTIVDSFATHVRLYRKAKERRRIENLTDIRACFFDLEAEYEQGICRDEVCMDRDKEKGKFKKKTKQILILMMKSIDQSYRISSTYCRSFNLYLIASKWISLYSSSYTSSSMFDNQKKKKIK